MVKNEVMSGMLLLSSVAQTENDVIVKNEVMSGRLFQSVYQVDSNMNKILQVVLLILGRKWILKKYQVENDDDLEWIRKKYRVDNDTKILKRYTKKF